MLRRQGRESAWQSTVPERDDEVTAAVREVLQRVPLVPPWTVEEFTAWLEDEFGRVVHLAPWPKDERPEPGQPGECAILITTASSFIISFDGAASERHQRQQIFHEIGHILCGHNAAGEFTGRNYSSTALSAGIDPETIDYVLHRGVFDTEEEKAAEMVGTYLAVLSRRQKGHSRFDRIASAFYEPIKK